MATIAISCAPRAPSFQERVLDAPEMAPVHDAIQRVLDGLDP